MRQHQQRERVGDQVFEAAVHERREENAGQSRPLTRPDAKILDPQIERPIQQLNEPD